MIASTKRRGRCGSFYQEGEVGVIASTKRAR